MRIAAAAVVVAACAGGRAPAAPDVGVEIDAPIAIAPDAPAVAPSTLDSNRDRLMTCAAWTQLDPSSQDVFRTITHRLWGSELADHSHALEHVTKLYKVVGGQGATATDPGSCGGGDYNRMFVQIDPALHAAQVAAYTRQGAAPYDLSDVVASSYWRDSHDLAGPHSPFDTSDETNAGAPRGQTQYFRDPASAAANQPLGRPGLETLVDPYVMEIDQDYDCTHNSNPDCDYICYGAACAPASQESGTQIYKGNYGDFEPAYTPC